MFLKIAIHFTGCIRLRGMAWQAHCHWFRLTNVTFAVCRSQLCYLHIKYDFNKMCRVIVVSMKGNDIRDVRIWEMTLPFNLRVRLATCYQAKFKECETSENAELLAWYSIIDNTFYHLRRCLERVWKTFINWLYTLALTRLRRTLHSTFVSNHHYDSLTITTQSVMFNAGNPVNIEPNASYNVYLGSWSNFWSNLLKLKVSSVAIFSLQWT